MNLVPSPGRVRGETLTLRGACRGQICRWGRVSRRNSHGGLYPRNPVLSAHDQEHLLLFPPDPIAPMMVRLNSAPLKRAFQQEISDVAKGMRSVPESLANQSFSLLPYLPENTYYMSVPR